jgi:hypothetical protein
VFAEIHGYKIRTTKSIVQQGAEAYPCIAVIKIFFIGNESPCHMDGESPLLGTNGEMTG